MSFDELSAYEIPAEADCIFWLWTTNAHMGDAYKLLEIWKFTPKTILTWAKPRFGVGDWLRGQTEHCILSTRGSPVSRPPGNNSTLLPGPIGQHSEKPEAFYKLVEALCPGSKAELFARKAREGWMCFGAEL